MCQALFRTRVTEQWTKTPVLLSLGSSHLYGARLTVEKTNKKNIQKVNDINK